MTLRGEWKRRAVAAAAAGALLPVACGGEAPRGLAPLPTPGSGPAVTPPLNMALLAQVPLADLASRPLTPVAAPPRASLSGAGNWGYASAINDGFLALLDVSNPRDVRERSRFFTGGRFTHNAWPTRDGRYVFTTDERPGRPVEAWDLIDPLQPRKVAEYIARTGTMPHNVMVEGDRLLVAHYTEGVHLLDVRDPERPTLVGSFDTHPAVAPDFAGVWGAYIFPGSDLVLASDMQGGLFVLRTGRQ